MWYNKNTTMGLGNLLPLKIWRLIQIMSNSDLKIISASEMILSHGDMLIKESQELIQDRTNAKDSEKKGKYDQAYFHLFQTSISCLQDIAQLLPSNPEEHRYSPACYFAIREVTDNFIDYFFLLLNPKYHEIKSAYLKRNIDCPNEHAGSSWTQINRYDRYLQGFWKFEEKLKPLGYSEKLTAEKRRNELKSFIAFISKMGHTDYTKFREIDSHSFLSSCYYNVLYMSACMLNREYVKVHNKPSNLAYMGNINFPLNLFQPEFIESLKPETT